MKFKDSLVSKMIITFTTIIAVSYIVMAAFLSVWFKNYYFDQRKDSLDNLGKVISKSAVKYFNNQEEARYKLQKELDYAAASVNSNIILTGSIGDVYAVSSGEYSDLLFKILDIKEMDELRFGSSIEKKKCNIEPFDKSSDIYMKPIFQGNNFKGIILMVTPLELTESPLNRVYTIIWGCAVVAVIISTIVIYYFSQKIIVKPLANMNYVARKISKGEVEKRAEIKYNDEIGELAKSFNIMADSLQRVEINRREFMSNVSHELRSPITSIKGFIGGILDGVIPKDKENYYLSIAYEEIQRLTRLVNDLLDLSAMESGKFSLNINEVDINEIIKLCVIKFEQKIKEKNLNVDVIFDEEHIYVMGDRDRLIQVVTNILDNSLKYVVDNGQIIITSKIKGKKVYVSIFNNGPIIHDNHITHIWERFYKDDKSRTSKLSTGLGLPIVRNILTQLGEDIWVENKGKELGVEFTFTLTRT